METSALQLIPAAVDRFGALVHAVDDHQWSDPTPCTEWTVRDLVNHVTGEHLWAPHLLAGETLEQVGDRYEGDVLGDDPVRAWDAAAERSRPLWEKADLAQIVHLSFGSVPLAVYADQMLADLTIHAWDLARGSGQSEKLDPVAVDYVLTWTRANVEMLAGLGIAAPPVPTTSTDPTVQLISLSGRPV